MSKQQHSASLQIVQDNQDLIQITQNSFQVELPSQSNFFQQQKIDDTFELSLDENSLSFHIEELKQQSTCNKIIKLSDVNSQIKLQNHVSNLAEKEQRKPLPVVQEQRKRKRKEIFQKYKQKTTQNILAGPQLQPRTNDIMNTFDQIFRIKSPQKTEKKESTSSNTSNKNIEQTNSIEITRFKKKQSTFGTVAISSFEQMPASISSPNQNYVEPPLVCKVQSKNSITEFQIPSNISQPQTVDPDSNLFISSTNSFILETEGNKISMIYAQQEDISRDSGDLETFLKSQIFRDQILDNTIRKNDTSYKNIEVSTINPSIMFDQQNEPSHTKNIEQRLGLTRDKSEASLPLVQNKELLKRNLSERNLKVFQTIQVQSANIIKQKVKSYEEIRIPVYLRQIRRKNTIYPNFHFKPKNKSFYQEQNTAFKELLSQFKKGLSFLSFINELANERHIVLSSLEKILLNSMTVETFLTCGWQKVYSLKEVNSLRLHQNFIKRKYDYEKVKGALNNYMYIVQYYQNCNLNLEDQKAQRKYLEIRLKFWQIQKNIKMIGEDIYLLAVQQIFPSHYYEFLTILKGPLPKFKQRNQQLEYFNNTLAKYYVLRQKGDILCLSEVGKYLRYKVQKMIQRAFMV